MSKRWTIEEVQWLRENSYKYISKDIAQQLNRSVVGVVDKCNELKLDWQKNINASINIDFFKHWSHDMAYILGFFTADGSLYKSRCNTYVFDVFIHKKDIEIIHFVKHHLSPNKRIVFFDAKQKSGLITPKARFTIINNKLCEPLLDLGLCEQKTYNKTLPLIPDKYQKDYLRGYFDGDGSLSISTRKEGRHRKRYTWSLDCISSEFLESIRSSFNLNMGKVRKGNGNFCWRISKREDVEKICEYMYNGHFCLKRKYDRYKNMEPAWIKTKYELDGKLLTTGELAKRKECTVNERTVGKRLRRGWSVNRAITTPKIIRKNSKNNS